MEYFIFTAEISRATFGMTPTEYRRDGLHPPTIGRNIAPLQNNLRDHMTDLELIFTMLGEALHHSLRQSST